jgi:hypothetical protein
MADVKFSGLPVAASLAAADLLAIAQGGTSKSITGTVLLTFVGTTYFPKAGGDIAGNTTIATNKILLNADGTAVFTGFVTMPFLLNNFPDAGTNTAPSVAEFSHSLTAGTAAANFGASIDLTADSTTTTRQNVARLTARWTDATHATRTGQIRLFAAVSGTLTELLRLDATSVLIPAGSLLFTDNTFDIGATGATRPRTIYVGTSAIIQKGGIGTTQTDALQLINSTAAINGTQQFSTALRLTGQGFGTTAGTSQATDWRIYVVPVQGTTATSVLQFDSSLNGAAFATKVTITSNGVLTAVGLVSTGNVTAAAASAFIFSGSTNIKAPSDGVLELLDTAGSSFNRLQFGGTTSSFPAIQRSSAGLICRLADDSADTTIRATAFNIGANPLNLALSVYAAGTVYTLTATNAKIDFGTTDPSLTITAPGTYALHGFAKVQVNGATFAANQTVTVLIRRTNNTPANITNSGTTWFLPTMTTLTQTIALIQMKEIFYTTANSDDVLELWADVSALPSAGTVTIEAASLTVIRVA